MGRYHCGGLWRDFQFRVVPATGLLGVVDPDAGITASITLSFRRSPMSTDTASYTLKGSFDDKSGSFHFEPLQWAGAHPAALEMIGIEGRLDAAARKVTAKMLSASCDAVEIVPNGEMLPPLPEQAAPVTSAADRKRPEMLMGATNVTNYLDVAARSPDFEYWPQAWSEPPGTIHEKPAIDEVGDRMKQDKFACGGSQRVTRDAAGAQGKPPRIRRERHGTVRRRVRGRLQRCILPALCGCERGPLRAHAFASHHADQERLPGRHGVPLEFLADQ